MAEQQQQLETRAKLAEAVKWLLEECPRDANGDPAVGPEQEAILQRLLAVGKGARA